MRLSAAVLLCSMLASCGYQDFTLPSVAGRELAHSSQPRFDWQARPEPVLSRGVPGQWDAVDVLNPSVVRFGGQFYNFYSGFDGKSWRTGLATSTDGVAWTKQGQILSPDPNTWEDDYIAANGAAIVNGSQILYLYQGGRVPRIGLATGDAGGHWTKRAAPVLETGPAGSWDERGVADPYVLEISDRFYLFYLGMDRARRQRLGVAVSNDARTWHKLRSNPVLELGDIGAFDEKGLGEPAVWAQAGWYWMLYTGRDHAENRRIGMARSRDGVTWEKTGQVFSGNEPWDSKVVCDPTVLIENDSVHVWFGGGNVASPDQNLNGQIGYAHLQTPTR